MRKRLFSVPGDEKRLLGSAEKPLLVLELANNHNGSVAHGKLIIDRAARALDGFGFEAAIKFQYRSLASLIHPKFKGNHEYRYIKRFEETRLSDYEFQELIDYSRARGFAVACTPFDEASVDKVCEHGFDYLKVASACANDWPLLSRVVEANLPTIVSTGGLSVRDLDRTVSFVAKRIDQLALMHCVARYPTPDDQLALNRLDLIRERFPGVGLGYSTHERPSNYMAVGLAHAKGAHIFERHIAEEDGATLVNDYSSSSGELRSWALSLHDAIAMTSGMDAYSWENDVEQAALRELRRGVYAKAAIARDSEISDDDVFFAIPVLSGQITVDQWSKLESKSAMREIAEGAALTAENARVSHLGDSLRDIIDRTRDLLKAGGVSLPGRSRVEVSHHYGLDKFFEFGAVLATVVNREYCKKVIVVFPGQVHPEHLHKKKEETFVVVFGDLKVTLASEVHFLKAGDVLTIPTGVPHGFTSTGGAVFEEISSTHRGSDSFYTDNSINRNQMRKSDFSVWSLVG